MRTGRPECWCRTPHPPWWQRCFWSCGMQGRTAAHRTYCPGKAIRLPRPSRLRSREATKATPTPHHGPQQHRAGHVDHVLDGCTFAAEHGEAEHAAHHAQAHRTYRRGPAFFAERFFIKLRLLFNHLRQQQKPYSAPAKNSPCPDGKANRYGRCGRNLLVSSHAGTRLPIADDSSRALPSGRQSPAERYKASSSEQ